LPSQGQIHANLFAADGSEASEEILERTTRLKESMRDAGFAAAESELSLQIEFYMRDLAAAWQADAEDTGSTEAITMWAARQLLSQGFEDVAEFATLEAQVRALGRLAGLTYAEATAQLGRIWCSTPAGSAAKRSQGSGRVRSSHFSTPKRTTPDRAGEDGGLGAGPAQPTGTPTPQVKREADGSASPRAGRPAFGAAGERVFVARGGGAPASPLKEDRELEMVKTLKEIQKALQSTPRGSGRVGRLEEEDLKDRHVTRVSIRLQGLSLSRTCRLLRMPILTWTVISGSISRSWTATR
jgi:hypothetical protein